MPMNKTLAAVALATSLAVMAGAAQAECMSYAQVEALVQSIAQRKPAPNPSGLSEADAACTRAKLDLQLEKRFGAMVGFKAGLTNAAVQQRFNYDKPVWGMLFKDMLLPNGATVDPAFGARPLYEADMLVRVKSGAINIARTPEEVLQFVDWIIPFVELPDLLVQAPAKLTGPDVSAINVGARLGVMGTPIAVPDGAAERANMLTALRDMTVRINDASQGGNNAELARGKGSDVLGHPLNAVVWLAQALGKEGLSMKPGDLISLGSFSPLKPPVAGQSISVSYDGLPGAQPVLVNFRPATPAAAARSQ